MQENKQILFKPIVFLLLITVTLFLLPLIIEGNPKLISGIIIQDSDQFWTTYSRGLYFSLIVSSISIILGFIVALYLRSIKLFSKAGKWLTVLFIPFFLGNVSVAFIFKMALMGSDVMILAYKSSFNIHLIISLIQIWQFGSLFTYLFWLTFQSIKPNIIDYAIHTNLSRWEFIRDIVVPHTKNLFILLFLLAFVFNFYEEAKLSLIFRASQGTDSELISHWLYRTFRSDLLINFNFASSKIYAISLFIIIPITLGIIILVSFALNKGIKVLCHSKIILNVASIKRKCYFLPYIITMGLSLIIIFPILKLFISLDNISFSNNFYSLTEPLIITTLAAALSSVFAIIFSVSSRLAWPKKMSTFNNFSILFIGILFLLLIVPPISLMVSGFYWTRLFNLAGYGPIIGFWLLGHSFLTLPILGSFTLINHFRVKENELDFHKVHKAYITDIINFSFVKRFKIEYVLTLIFAFSLIWNEAVLNRVFSDSIPSFVSAIISTVSSRNADFSVGLAYFTISLLLALTCISLWIMVVERAKKIITKNEEVRS